MKWLVKGVLCIVCLTLAACATLTDRLDRSEEFERSVKAYNRMLRWHEIESAGMTYIEPEQREDYLKRAETLKKRGLSVTDFRILTTVYTPETKTGDAVVEFDYFILPSNRVKTVTYRQKWVYMGSLKSWKLKSGLPDFE